MIFDRWPQFFLNRAHARLSGMDKGFRCADGWFQLIWDLCSQLQPLSAEFEGTQSPFEILQVKSKFGELRFAPNRRNNAIDSAIEATRQRSGHTCELCGNFGTRRPDSTGWWSALCEECRNFEPDLRPYL